MADTSPFVYRVFLLRCWQEPTGVDGPVARRFSLEDPATGRRYGFTWTADLVEFLEQALDQDDDIAPPTLADVTIPE